jgi:hypothetical protein
MPDKAFLELAKKGTLKALTTVKPRVSISNLGNSNKHSNLTFANITREVERTTRELFRHKKFSTQDLLSNPYMPSLSANHVTSRKALGTFGFLLSEDLLGVETNEHFHITETFPEMGDREESRRQSPMRNRNPTFKLTGLNSMRDRFVKTYFDTLKLAMSEWPIAQAVPLAEALKARVITKGPPATQFCLSPMQRFMHDELRRHPVFELIGKPQNASIIENQLKTLLPGEFWLSGDYSDATNQLDPRLSEVVWETLCNVCCVPTAIRELGFRALTGHLIQMEDGELVPQRWGQLMGSIISFPVLVSSMQRSAV